MTPRGQEHQQHGGFPYRAQHQQAGGSHNTVQDHRGGPAAGNVTQHAVDGRGRHQDESQQCYEEAASLLSGLDLPAPGARAYLELATLHEQAGRVDDALRYYRRATEVIGLAADAVVPVLRAQVT